MKTTREYIDAIATKNDGASDYRIAKLLGVTRSTVSRYRCHQASFDDNVALRAAELLGIEPLEIIASANYERAKRPEIKTAWERLAKLAAGTLGALIFSVFSLFGGSAGTAQAGQSLEPSNIHYANRRRRWLAAVLVLFSGTALADRPDLTWNDTDQHLMLTYTALHVADWHQSRNFADGIGENNRVLGRSPSKQETDAYFASTLALQWLIAKNLPAGAVRRIYQLSWIVVEANLVQRNMKLGVRFAF